jgi:hypothetical protein
MATRYLLVLDRNSPVGRLYAESTPPPPTTDGSVAHPVLDCTEVDLSNPGYVEATGSHPRGGGPHQSVFLPHASVVRVIRYDVKDGLPAGYDMPQQPRTRR